MSEHDDMLPPSEQQLAAAQPDPAPRPSATQAGLTPLTLLTEDIPLEQRQLISWLARRKQATAEEVRQFLLGRGLAAERIQPTLEAALESNLLHQAILAGEVCYRVVFQGRARRAGIGLPDEVWQRVDQDRVSFLRSLTLFSSLNDDQLRAIADQMEEVRYQRGDVLLWQGKSSDQVFFIKSGIVGITHYAAHSQEQKVLNYVRQGEIIGEYSAISGAAGVPSATASALSSVYALTLKREAFLAILEQHASVAIELARILAVRLVNSSRRASSKSARLIVLIGTAAGIGTSSLGMALALTLAAKLGRRAAYTELPDSRHLAELFALEPDQDTFAHGGGYDVIAQAATTMLPPSVRATLLLDQLFAHYADIVVSVPRHAEETIAYLVGYADQVVLVGAPTPEGLAQLAALTSAMRRQVNPERVGLFSVLKYGAPEAEHADLSADFILPYYPTFAPHAALTPDELPEAIRHFAAALVDRLGRANAVSLYIPTTIDVNTSIDTTPYVERTLSFLGQLFGGATTTTLQARGVWNSAEVGLVSEGIHIVRSYATQADLDTHLQTILDYVEGLKRELRQEAMAVEINQRLMLV